MSGCSGARSERSEQIQRQPQRPAPAQPSAASATTGDALLVELFTSQGCSSCPPADRLLGELDAAGERPIIALAYHVDYWNYLGWSDPFSSSRWSDRQRAYARTVATDRVYTPQLIIHGRAHAVGSRPREVAAGLDRVAAAVTTSARLEVAADRDSARVRVAVKAFWAGELPGRALDIWVALYQDGVDTRVERGENAGRVLRNGRIVRDLRHVAVLAAGAGEATGVVDVPIAAAWRASALGAAVFVQDPDTLQIHGAAGVEPAAMGVDSVSAPVSSPGATY